MDRLLPNGLTPRDSGLNGWSKFTKQEDQKLLKLVKAQGKFVNWKDVSLEMQTRTPRQCRERYQNYLKPSIDFSKWTDEEDQTILKLVQLYGSKWNTLAKQMHGRTGNAVRNRYQVLMRRQKKKEKMQQKEANNMTQKPSPPPAGMTIASEPSILNIFDNQQIDKFPTDVFAPDSIFKMDINDLM